MKTTVRVAGNIDEITIVRATAPQAITEASVRKIWEAWATDTKNGIINPNSIQAVQHRNGEISFTAPDRYWQ